MTTQFDHQDSNRLADQVAYDPNNLLDSLIEKLHLKNDAALSRALEVAPPVISKIRHRRLPVQAPWTPPCAHHDRSGQRYARHRELPQPRRSPPQEAPVPHAR